MVNKYLLTDPESFKRWKFNEKQKKKNSRRAPGPAAAAMTAASASGAGSSIGGGGPAAAAPTHPAPGALLDGGGRGGDGAVTTAEKDRIETSPPGLPKKLVDRTAGQQDKWTRRIHQLIVLSPRHSVQ